VKPYNKRAYRYRGPASDGRRSLTIAACGPLTHMHGWLSEWLERNAARACYQSSRPRGACFFLKFAARLITERLFK
jgi:hypothetical protein